MPLWLLSGFLGIRKALAAVFGVALRYPWQAACLALVLFAGWQTHSLHRAHAALSACEKGRKDDRDTYKREQQEALRRAVAAKEAQEADYRAKAKEADHEHEAQLASVRAATDEFIRTHRVRYQAPASAPGRSAASPQSSDPILPSGMPADSVLVGAADVQTCGADYSYAVAAREWALSLAR